MEEPEANVDFAVWRDGGAGRDPAWPVLRAVLSPDDSKEHPTSANYIVATALLLGMPFCRHGSALGPDRPQAPDDGRLPAGCAPCVPIYRAMQRVAGSGW